MSKKQEKAKFDKWFPKDKCDTCNGDGKVKSEYFAGGFFSAGHWDYKKCSNCKGTGKNIWTCMTCEEKMYHSDGFACVNKNCKMYNIKVLLANQDM